MVQIMCKFVNLCDSTLKIKSNMCVDFEHCGYSIPVSKSVNPFKNVSDWVRTNKAGQNHGGSVRKKD